MSHIILLTQWTGGDVRPFLRLGTYLKNDGHRVSLLTHSPYESEAKRLGFGFRAIDSPEEYEEIVSDLHLLADPIGGRDEYLSFHKKYHGKERLLREVSLIEDLMQEDSEDSTDSSEDLLIIARFRSGIAGQLAAEKHHLRYASMILAPNYFSHMELHEELFGRELCAEINSAREALQLPPILSWKDWLYSPKMIFCGWPKWYAEADETWAAGAFPIGFLADPEEGKKAQTSKDFSSKEFEKKPYVVITGGSSRMVSPAFYQTAVEACERAKAEAIVVTPFRDYLPDELPEGIRWIDRTPLPQLFEGASLVIHHGGMGTINEAIDAGIPHIILPHLTDGPDNADRLVRLRIGKKFAVKQWDPERIAEAIREITGADSGIVHESDTIQERCEVIRKQNLETFREKSWREAIRLAPVYELPEQKITNTEEKKEESVTKNISKAMLLQMVRRNRLKASEPE